MNRFTVCFIVCLFFFLPVSEAEAGCSWLSCFSRLWVSFSLKSTTILRPGDCPLGPCDPDQATPAQLGGPPAVTEEPSDKMQVRCNYMN